MPRPKNPTTRGGRATRSARRGRPNIPTHVPSHEASQRPSAVTRVDDLPRTSTRTTPARTSAVPSPTFSDPREYTYVVKDILTIGVLTTVIFVGMGLLTFLINV